MSHLAASDAESAIRKTPTKIPSSSSSYSTSRNSQYGSLSRTSTSSITSADSLGHEHHLKKQPSFDSSTRSPSRTSTHQRSTLPPKSPRHKTPVNSPSKQLPTPSKPDASQALSPVRAKTNDAHRAAKTYKNWTPDHLSAYIRSSAGFDSNDFGGSSDEVIRATASWVTEQNLGGRAFLQLTEEDLDELDVPAAWRNVLFSTWQELREDAKQDRASSPSKVRPASRRLPWNLPSKSVADKQGTPASIPEVPPVESTNITPEAQTPGVAEKQSVQDLSAVPPQDTPESVPSDAVPLDPGAEPSIEASPLAPSVEFGAPNTMLTETTVPFSVVQTGSDIEEPTPMSENTLSVTSTEDTNLAPDTSAEDPPTLDQSASEEGLIVQPPIGATTVPAFEHVDVPEPSVSDASEEEPSPAPIVDVVEHEVSEELTTPIAEATISPPEAESLTIAEDPVIEADSAPIPEPEFVILPTTTILPSEEVVSLPSAQDNTQTVDSTELLENDVPQVTLSVPPELASEEPEPEKDDLLEEPETQKENADLPYPSDNTHAEPAPSPTVDVDTLDRIKRLEERIVELEALLRGSERTIETMREEVRAVGDHLVQQAQRTIQHTRDLSAVLDNMSGISRSIKAVGLAQLIPLVIYSSFGFYALLRTVRASR